MIVLRSKEFSVRPYAKKLISESEKLVAQGKDKWEIARNLGRAKERYYKESLKVKSLNPAKIMKRSKDSSDSERALSGQILKILQK